MKKAIFVISVIILIIGCKSNDQKTLIEKLYKPSETFILNTDIDTILQGKEGTLIFIEKESFTDQHGNIITDSIRIELKEIYNTEDIITERISMKSNGRILETGGMINLKAFSDGNELQLNYGTEIIVHFPKNGNSVDMNLFYGKEGTTKIIEWELDESSTYRLRTEILEWYTKYEYLDDPYLYLVDGSYSYDTVHHHFSLTKEDEEELVNKNIDANYMVYNDGEMEYQSITGSKISDRLRTKIKDKVKSYPKCKPYTREGSTINMPGHFAIQTRVIQPNYKTKNNYLETLEEKINSGTTKGLEIAELQYYIFDSKELGWMNCDRFIEQSSERIDFIVKVPKSENVFAKLVFTDYNTVMTGNEKEGEFIFEDLPINESIKIVVLDEKRGKSLLKIVDSKTTKRPIEVKDLTEYTLEELKEQLKGIK